MGSWYSTCMISNLPIVSGDEVKLILLSTFIQEDKFPGSSFCYASGLMCPAFLPLDGKYEDCGKVEEMEKNWNYNIISSTLKKKYKKINVNDKTMEKFELEDILFGIERSDLGKSFQVMHNKDIMQPEDMRFVNAKLGFVMIRKDVWDGICSRFTSDVFWNDRKEETEYGKYYVSAQEYCKRKFDKYIESVNKMKLISVKIEENKDNKEVFLELMNDLWKLRDDSVFRFRREEGGLHIGGHEYDEFVMKCDFDKEEMFKSWSELVIINSFFEATRKSWMIQQGAGSQSQEWETYTVLNKIIGKICNKKIKEFKKNY